MTLKCHAPQEAIVHARKYAYGIYFDQIASVETLLRSRNDVGKVDCKVVMEDQGQDWVKTLWHLPRIVQIVAGNTYTDIHTRLNYYRG